MVKKLEDKLKELDIILPDSKKIPEESLQSDEKLK
jgi:hypothetical protein